MAFGSFWFGQGVAWLAAGADFLQDTLPPPLSRLRQAGRLVVAEGRLEEAGLLSLLSPGIKGILAFLHFCMPF